MKDSSKILTGLSHEIRSCMNAIVGLSFLLEKAYVKEVENTEYSNKIFSHCNKLNRIFENFIDSSMIDLGVTKQYPRKCTPKSILEDLTPELNEVLIEESKDSITIVYESDNSDVSQIIIDSQNVKRILQNLFHNAVSGMDKGFIKIGNKINDNKITFYIIGSSQDYKKALEFFYTDDMDHTLSKFFDTISAVNVTVAKKIIYMLGGSISVEKYGLAGTGIYFSLPLKEYIESQVKSETIHVL